MAQTGLKEMLTTWKIPLLWADSQRGLEVARMPWRDWSGRRQKGRWIRDAFCRTSPFISYIFPSLPLPRHRNVSLPSRPRSPENQRGMLRWRYRLYEEREEGRILQVIRRRRGGRGRGCGCGWGCLISGSEWREAAARCWDVKLSNKAAQIQTLPGCACRCWVGLKAALILS